MPSVGHSECLPCSRNGLFSTIWLKAYFNVELHILLSLITYFSLQWYGLSESMLLELTRAKYFISNCVFNLAIQKPTSVRGTAFSIWNLTNCLGQRIWHQALLYRAWRRLLLPWHFLAGQIAALCISFIDISYFYHTENEYVFKPDLLLLL